MIRILRLIIALCALIAIWACGDTVPASKPTEISATAASDSQITLTWSMPESIYASLDHYNVYRNAVQIATTTNSFYYDIGYEIGSLAPSTTYCYYVTATDTEGSESAVSDEVCATTNSDSTAPGIPPQFTATISESSSVELSWTDATDNDSVESYNIYRDSTLINSTSSTSYEDVEVESEIEYCYTISAIDPTGNESSQTNSVCVYIGDLTKPEAPTALIANALSNELKVELSWTASTDNIDVTEYYIYRDSVRMDSTTETSYTDTTVLPGTTYSYYIIATDASGNVSDASEAVSATTPTDMPTSPELIITQVASPLSVDLTWSESEDIGAIARYDIYRNDILLSNTSGLSYSDTAVSTSTQYCYQVKTVDIDGNTALSNETCLTTGVDSEVPSFDGAALTASAIDNTSISLVWDAASDDVGISFYMVELYKGIEFVRIIKSADASYVVDGLSPETSYTFNIYAVDTAGKVSSGAISSNTYTKFDVGVTISVPATIVNGIELRLNLIEPPLTVTASSTCVNNPDNYCNFPDLLNYGDKYWIEVVSLDGWACTIDASSSVISSSAVPGYTQHSVSCTTP